jgi:hypothetical protein
VNSDIVFNKRPDAIEAQKRKLDVAQKRQMLHREAQYAPQQCVLALNHDTPVREQSIKCVDRDVGD